MKMKKVWALLIAMSMIICQNAVFVASAEEEATTGPLVYYDFGDTAEWSNDDILRYTSDGNTENALGVSPEKRVREYAGSYNVSFKDDGAYGQVLEMPAKKGAWMAYYINDGSGTEFNTNRDLYVKAAIKISDNDAASTSTKLEIGWYQPWQNVYKFKNGTAVETQDGWYVFSGKVGKSSHNAMTNKGAVLGMPNGFYDAYALKYFALFETQEAADAWDPSVESVTSNGVNGVIDSIAHTVSFAETVKGNPELILQEGCSAVKTLDVDNRTYGMGRLVKYDVTDIAGNVKEWTVTYGEVKDAPSILEEREYGEKKFYIYDFSTSDNMEMVTLNQAAWTGYDTFSKVQYDDLDTLPVTTLDDAYGPAMEVTSNGAAQWPYILLNDSIDTNYRFAKLAYGVYQLNLDSEPGSSVEYNGTLGFGEIYQTSYLTAVNDADSIDAAVTNSLGETVEVGTWTSSVVEIPESADETAPLDIYTVNTGDAGLFAESRIAYKYIALFDNAEDAAAYDPSIVSAEFNGAAMEIDNIAHTMNVALNVGVAEGSIDSISDQINIATLDEDIVAISSETPEVIETEDTVTVTQNFNVTGIDGKTVVWTATVSAPLVEPTEDYLFYDFTVIPSNEDIKLVGISKTENWWNDYPNGVSIGKTAVDQASDIFGANVSYGGPGLFVKAANATTPYTHFLMYSDDFDMTSTKYVRIEYAPASAVELKGSYTEGKVFAMWDEGSEGDDKVIYAADALPTAGELQTVIVAVEPCNHTIKSLRIAFYGFTEKVNVKNVGIFESRAEAEAFDSTIRSVRIADNRNETKAKMAKINGVTHTATVEIEDNVVASDMPIITAEDITDIVTDNPGATTEHNYVQQVPTASYVEGSEKVTENLTSVMSSVDYEITDMSGDVHTWTFILKSNKTVINNAQDQSSDYYVMDFSNVETVEDAIANNKITKRTNVLNDLYPANATKTNSALYAVNDGGKVELDIDFPGDETKYLWYSKILLNYTSAIDANKNVQIHWSINWPTTGKTTTFENGLGAGEWTSVSTDLKKAAVEQPLGLYSNTGSDMSFKYIAWFRTAEERDAFDPSVVGAKIEKDGRTYYANIDNVAHTMTFPTGCATTEDLDAAVIGLYNDGNGISIVSNGDAVIESDYENDTYEIVKSYTVTGLDGQAFVWTAKVPFAPVEITCGEDSATVTYADATDNMGMQKIIAVYKGNAMLNAFMPENNVKEISFADYESDEYTIKAFGFDGVRPIIKNKTEMFYKN